MKVWEEMEGKLAQLSSHNRTKQKFLTWTNYYGQAVEVDGQGRILIPPVLTGSGADEGRRGRDGPPDLLGSLEPRPVAREPEEEPDHGRRPEDFGRAGHLAWSSSTSQCSSQRRWTGWQSSLSGFYVDATVGLGGHAIEIARRLGAGGRLLGLDRDAQALEIARGRLAEFGEKVSFGARQLFTDRRGLCGTRASSRRWRASGSGRIEHAAGSGRARLFVSRGRPARHAHGPRDRKKRLQTL